MKNFNTLLLFFFLFLGSVMTGFAQVNITCPSYFETVVDVDPGSCYASMVEYEVTATGGPSADLPAFYPLYDDLADELGNANDGSVYGPVNPPTPGNPVCVPPGAFYLDRFSTPAFLSFDGNAFKFSTEFKLNGFGTNTFSGNPILMMNPAYRWIGIFTNPDGKIGIVYLNSNYVPSTTTVSLDQWYKVELVFDNGTAYLYLDDVLIQTVVTGTLEYPGFDPLTEQPWTSNLLTGNGSTGTALNGCIRNVRVSNLNDDDDPEPEEITITDNAPDEFPLGYTYVTATATTESGSSASCYFYVQVRDNQAPDAVCKNTTVQVQGQGYTYLADDDLLDYDLTIDNCTDYYGYDNFYITSRDRYYVYCEDVGNTYPVTVGVTDYNGNATTCTAMITVEEGTELPGGWQHANVGTATGDAEYPACSENDIWTLESNGPSFGFQDKLHYAWTSFCGNGEIIARVANVTNGGWAGLMMRENSSTGSRMVRLKTQLSNFVRREVRVSPNSMINTQQLPVFQHTWLRLVKQGDLYLGYTSYDGTNWKFALYVHNPMGNCVQVGLMAEGLSSSSTAVATFDNVSVSGGGSMPTLSIPEAGLDFDDATSTLAEVSLYPNPASDEVQIDLNNFNQEDLNLTLINNLGQVVYQQHLQQVETTLHTVQVSDLAPGLYFVRMERSSGEVISKRLIVE